MKFGGQYRFDFGLTISYMYEDLHREVPQVIEFQNERQRTGDWVALEYDFNGGRDRVAVGWAHAGATSAIPADSTTTTRMASATTRRTCTRSPGGTSWTSS